MYSHILYKHSTEGEWLFIHYDQLLKAEGLDKIQMFTEAEIDKTFPESVLNRSKTDDTNIPNHIEQIYKKLCDLAEIY
jgi:hypothetical protein